MAADKASFAGGFNTGWFFVCYYLARKKITPTSFGLLFFACNAGVLAVELARATPVYGLSNSAHYTLTPTKKPPVLPQKRDWKFDEYKHFPFAMLGPAALHVYTASMTATMAPQFTNMEAPTHCIDLIQLPRFTKVMTQITDTAARRIQGNTLPVVRLVYAVTRASCTEEAINLVQKNTNALSRWAPVEGPLPDHIATPSLPAPTQQAA